MTTPATTIQPFPIESERWLAACLAPGQVFEIRAIDAVIGGSNRPAIVSGYFDSARAAVHAVSGIIAAKGVYWTANPINPALLARAANRLRIPGKEPTTSDADILSRRWLLIDVDPLRPAGISASAAEHDSAIEHCRTIREALGGDGWPEPILGDSGNGGHLMYRVDLPRDTMLIEQCLDALAVIFDRDGLAVDCSVHNPARIWKLYGTLACKGDSTSDRPHRVSRILEMAERSEGVVAEYLLERLITDVAGTGRQPKSSGKQPPAGSGPVGRMVDYIARHNLAVGPAKPYAGSGNRWVFEVCPWNSAHTDKSAVLIEFPSGAKAAMCHHDGCRGKNWHDLRDVNEPGWREEKAARDAVAPVKAKQPTATTSSGLVDCVPVDQMLVRHPNLREPIVRGLLRRGEVMNLISSPKIGKSWLILDLAMAVASGRPWLDEFQCTAGRVLLIDNELHEQTLAFRIDRIAKANGCLLEGLPISVLALRGMLCDIRGLSDYLDRDADRSNSVSLVIMDAFYRFLPKDSEENSNSDVTELYNLIDKYAQKTGAAFVLVHHTSKGDQSGKAIHDVGAGAGAQARAADSHLILRPHEEDKTIVLDAAVRSWPPIEPIALRQDSDMLWRPSGSDPARLLVRGKNGKPVATRAGNLHDVEVQESAIDAYIKANPTASFRKIQSAVGGSFRDISDAKKRLKNSATNGVPSATNGSA